MIVERRKIESRGRGRVESCPGWDHKQILDPRRGVMRWSVETKITLHPWRIGRRGQRRAELVNYVWECTHGRLHNGLFTAARKQQSMQANHNCVSSRGSQVSTRADAKSNLTRKRGYCRDTDGLINYLWPSTVTFLCYPKSIDTRFERSLYSLLEKKSN